MQDNYLTSKGQRAKDAAFLMAGAPSAKKNQALQSIADELNVREPDILLANQKDLNAARQKGLNEAMLDRLSLQGRIEGVAKDIEKIIALPDPIGEVFEQATLPNGLSLSKHRTPLGVLGVIYEARPNVTLDIAALAIKTGNCAILRGGTETLHTNMSLIEIIQNALKKSGLPIDAIQYIDNPERSLVKQFLHMHEYLDLIIPRGGASLHQFCRENSTIPVITGGIGICHLYVDEGADLEAAIKVIHNAKTQRPTVCNALDTVLVNAKAAVQLVPELIQQLGLAGVSFRLDNPSWEIFSQNPPAAKADVQKAQQGDWDTEWLSLILGIKVVADLQEAIAHIHQHSTGHSDGILTRNDAHAEQFIKEVDSAAVYVNASTRFTDGSEFGLGAEVAISTQKLHARGPMGLKELTSYKWVVRGNNHVRQ